MEQENWKNIQRKTFTKWLNTKIVNPIDDLYTGLKDGVVLCELLYKLSNVKIVHNRVAITRFQKIENVQNALIFLENNKIKLINIGSADIVDGSEKLTLGLVWTIIKRFVVCKEHASNDGLLKWCKAATAGYDVDIRDFGKSWKDGMAFNAIINRFRPDLVDYSSMTRSDPLKNLEQAFSVAEKKLSIPRLIDPEDIATVLYPDEKCIMTYVSQFRDKFGDFKDKEVQNKVDNFIFAYDKMNKNEFCLLNEQDEYERLVKEIKNVNEQGNQLLQQYRKLYIQNQNNVESLMWKRLNLYSMYGTMKTLNNFYKINKTLSFSFLTEKVKNEIRRCESCMGKVNAMGINMDAFNFYNEILSCDISLQRQIPELRSLVQNTKDERIRKLIEEKLVIYSSIVSKNDNNKIIKEGQQMFKRLDTYGKNKLKPDEISEILELLGLLNKENSKEILGNKTEFTERDLIELITRIYEDGFDVKKIRQAFKQLSDDGKYIKVRSLNNSINSIKDITIDKNGEEKIDIDSMFDRLSIDK